MTDPLRALALVGVLAYVVVAVLVDPVLFIAYKLGHPVAWYASRTRSLPARR